MGMTVALFRGAAVERPHDLSSQTQSTQLHPSGEGLMEKVSKRAYVKPQLRTHGSVEEVTGWTGSRAGEFFGGPQGGAANNVASNRIGFKLSGPGCSH